MKIAEQKRASTAGRNDNDGHHAIDSSTARTDKQSNVFKSTDDGDGLKGRNKNLRRNKMITHRFNKKELTKEFKIKYGAYFLKETTKTITYKIPLSYEQKAYFSAEQISKNYIKHHIENFFPV